MTTAPERAQAVPTADPRVEAALIGIFIVNARDQMHLVGQLSVEDFSDWRYQAIWSAITNLVENGRHVDAVTIHSVLEERGEAERIGGMETLMEAQASVVSFNGADYASRLKELTSRRRADAAAANFRAAIGSGQSLASAIDEFLGSVASEGSRRMTLSEGLDEYLRSLETQDSQSRVSSGIPELDQKLNGGLRHGQLLVVGARPSMGKSAFALGWAYEAAKHGERVLFVTAEMPVEELAMRLIAREARLSISKLASGGAANALSELEWHRLGAAIVRLSEVPMDFIDEANPSVGEIRAQVMGEAASGRPYGLVIVDYLQLLAPSERRQADNRQLDVSAMSRGLKILAREMRVPVIALSQLSRAPESRATHRPLLSDLRESGALEQDADVVLAIFRPEVYEPGNEPGVVELIVLKNRSGTIGTARAVFLGEQAAVLPAARSEDPRSERGAPRMPPRRDLDDEDF